MKQKKVKNMKQNNKVKGFTLIELLAVIVILAIIALIVTPVVSNIVANARIAANARSVEGHIRNIELAIITKAFGENSTGDLDSFDTITSGATIESSLSRPGNDKVTCSSYSIEHGKVINARRCKSSDNSWDKKYKYTITNGAEVEDEADDDNQGGNAFNGTYVPPISTDTHKGIIYMDPTNLSTSCNTTSTITTTSSGCKKFYIYKDDTDYYYLINDRNLGADIAYNSANTNDSKSDAFETAFDNATENWIGDTGLIDVADIAHLTGADREDTIKWSSSKTYAAIPTNIDTQSSWFYFDGGKCNTKTIYTDADDVYSDATDGWQLRYAISTPSTTIKSDYYWLYDYTNLCEARGCYVSDSSTNGYWTNTKLTGNATNMYTVINYGRLGGAKANVGSDYGIRPTLKILKSLIG